VEFVGFEQLLSRVERIDCPISGFGDQGSGIQGLGSRDFVRTCGGPPWRSLLFWGFGGLGFRV
jgi:hypothetical protein